MTTAPTPSRTAVVTLRRVTSDNLRDVLRLSNTLVEPQNRMVAPNSVSVAQAHFSDEAWFRAIYADETPVGFLMVHVELDEKDTLAVPEFFLWRFMIAAPYQGMGFGRRAIERLVEHVKRYGAAELTVSCEEGEGSPEGFYRTLGFERDGTMHGDEVGLRLAWPAPPPRRLKCGFVLPRGDARTAAELAWEAEDAGWDGFFVWDAPWGTDPWVALAAVAVRTRRIRIGTMITPVSRRRPWKLAAETATHDHLSHGRLILAVGLGAIDTGFAEFGEATDRRTRAELLDEGLDVVAGLWHGQPFRYEGRHYHVREVAFRHPPPPPVQQPRIPVWVVGGWPREKSMQRVLRWDGLLPNKVNADGSHGEITPDDLRAMHAYIQERRTAATPFDIVMEGTTPGNDPAGAAAIVRPWADAGATWWLEALWSQPPMDEILARIRQGPPG